ncbi:MAG TPA: hypothetical protein VJ785_03915 [Anaerolineales bacterium]|nr:hypothetical protein [Anaerolineales bacterium]
MAEKEMRGFEDLECYQLAMAVFRESYRVVSLLPVEENIILLTSRAALQPVVF